MNYIDKKMTIQIYEDILRGRGFPKFGSPETKCNRCMFYEVACFPSSEYVGCFSGWKREDA